MKSLKKIQENTNIFCKENKIDTTIEIRTLDLVSEVGELCKEIIKSTNYGTKEYKITENTENELGDVFFVLILIANQLNINLETALEKVLEKYKKRLEKGSIGSK